MTIQNTADTQGKNPRTHDKKLFSNQVHTYSITVIVLGYGIEDPSSNHRRGFLHFTWLGKGENYLLLPSFV